MIRKFLLLLVAVMLVGTASALPPLVAGFSAEPLDVCINTPVLFTDETEGLPTSWKWAFGDGIQSEDQNPTHSYVFPGTYTVSLLVGDGITTNLTIKTDYITVRWCASGDECCATGVPELDIPVCGDVDFFFFDDTSDFGSTYDNLAVYPQPASDKIMSATVSSATGPKTIGSFITDPFPDGKVIAPGLWRFRTYLNVSSAVGVTTYQFIPFNVSATGVESELWYGVSITEEVNELVAKEYLHSYARRNYTEFLPGERLLIRVNVSTTSVTSRTAYFNVAGNTKASMVSVGYWICCTSLPLVTNSSYVNGQAGLTPLAIVIFFAIIGIALLILSFLVPPEKGGSVLGIMSPVALLVAAYKMLSIDIVTGYGVVSSATEFGVIENHTIYQMYPEAVVLLIIFVISLLNVYRVIMASRMDDSQNYRE